MSKCSGPERAGTPACQKRFEFCRPRFLSRYLLVAVALAGGSIVAAAAPPNLIVILADDKPLPDPIPLKIRFPWRQQKSDETGWRSNQQRKDNDRE